MGSKASDNLMKIRDLWSNIDAKKRKIYFFLLALCVAVAVIAVLLLNHKNYAPLYLNLDSKECGEIMAKLEEMNVPYQLRNGTAIYVEQKNAPRIKMQLAGEGFPKSGLNFDAFKENINFMSTDYEKRQYAKFQMQEWIQASIKTLENVDDAIVTLAVPDNSMAVLNEDKIEPTASVLLKLRGNMALEPKQVRGIKYLVSCGVPGLKEENVSIIDQTGATIGTEEGDPMQLATTGKLQMENQAARIISERIAEILEPMYGKGNVRVGVNVVLDFSQKTSEEIIYSPSTGNTGVVNEYERVYEGPENGKGAPGGVPGADSNSEIPGYETPVEGETNENVKDQVKVSYLISQLKEQIRKEGAELKDATIGLVINRKEMTAEETEKVIGIVAHTAGVAKEKVELFSSEWPEKPAVPTFPEPVTPDYFSLPYLVAGGAVLFSLLMIVILITAARSRRKKRKQSEQAAARPAETPAEERERMIDLSKMTETKEQQLSRELREFSNSAPQITASLLRTLLKGDFE